MFVYTPESKILIQGISEPLALCAIAQMKACNSNIVAGVCPGKGGQKLSGIPVFDLVEQATRESPTIINTSIIFVRPYRVLDAALEAMAAGIRQLIIMTKGVPPLDTLALLKKAKITQTAILGPGSGGLIVPGKVLLGLKDYHCYQPGPVGVIDRTEGLGDAIAWELTQAGFGQSLGVHLGTGAIIGSSFPHWLEIFNKDKNTEAIVILEQSYQGNQAAATTISKNYPKPIIAYITGQHLPENSLSLNLPSLITSGQSIPIPHTSTAAEKIAACQKAKIPVANSPYELTELLEKVLK